MNATARQIQPTDFERLLRLYARFEPKGAYRGLPPTSLGDIEKWLHQLTGEATQFIVEVGDRIVGHSYLRVAPDKPEAEVGIFVHQDFRSLSLGKTLLLGTLYHGCKELHLKRIWLKLTKSNFVARRVLDQFGFYARDPADPSVLELEFERPSSCAKCRGERCIIFGKSLPITVNVPKLVGAYPDRVSAYAALKKARLT